MLETVILLIIGFVSVLTCIVLCTHVLKGKKLYTRGTNATIYELAKQERELFDRINDEINKSGSINKIILKWRLGEIYDLHQGKANE